MKVQIVTPYRDSHLQRYGVTVRGNVTSVYHPLEPKPEPNSKCQTFYTDNRDVHHQPVPWQSTSMRATRNSERVMIIEKLCGQQTSHKVQLESTSYDWLMT
jgi:hypothetical protein